jgi:hypothetical protein
MQPQPQNTERQAPRLGEHVMTAEGQKTILANPACLVSSHDTRLEFYKGHDRMFLQTKQIQRVRELQESNDNFQRQISLGEKELPHSDDPLSILAEIDQCNAMIARNTGEILNIHTQNEFRLKRIAELEAQNIDLQQEMSDNQSKFMACHEMNQRTRCAADFFLSKSRYEKNLIEVQELKLDQESKQM